MSTQCIYAYIYCIQYIPYILCKEGRERGEKKRRTIKRKRYKERMKEERKIIKK